MADPQIKVDVQVTLGWPFDTPGTTVLWHVGTPVERQRAASRGRVRKHRPSHSNRRHTQEFTVNLLDSQNLPLSVSFKDKEGNPVSPDAVGALSWASSDETIATVTDNGDGTALVVSTGTLGDTTISVSDDTDGDGSANFQGTLAVSVVAGDVAEIDIAPGDPVDR